MRDRGSGRFGTSTSMASTSFLASVSAAPWSLGSPLIVLRSRSRSSADTAGSGAGPGLAIV